MVMVLRERSGRPSPFEDTPVWRVADRVFVALSCLLLVPLLRVLVSVVCAALGALWCLLVAGLWYPLELACGSQQRRVVQCKLAILRIAQQCIQRFWLLVGGGVCVCVCVCACVCV